MTLDPAKLHFDSLTEAGRWVIAYSGGVDSHVLLHLLVRFRDRAEGPVPPLLALHVNHGMHPHANRWQSHCELVCEALDVAFHAEVTTLQQSTRSGLERLAREARYTIFEKHLGKGDLLLQAHHLDDQAETVLLRLFRGAGPDGLAAIPAQRKMGEGRLIRPLLPYSRAELVEYANSNRLAWVEDPGNSELQQDRNFIRHQLMPVLQQRWPNAARKLADSAELCRTSSDILTEIAAADIGAALGSDRFDQEFLALEMLSALESGRLRNAIRFWLKTQAELMPSRKQLDALVNDVLEADADATPRWLVGKIDLRRYAQRLYRVRLPDCAVPVEPIRISEPGTIKTAILGEFQINESRSGGVRPGKQVEIRFGSRAQRCRLQGASISRSLKRHYQDLEVPPWLRARLPLVYVDGKLAAIADLAICEGHQAANGELGWKLHWRPDARPIVS